MSRGISGVRVNKAARGGKGLFAPFMLPKPCTSPKHIFWLREARIVNGADGFSLSSHPIEVPNVDFHREVEIHLVRDMVQQVMVTRIWWDGKTVRPLAAPLSGFAVCP
jgi:hypothetical protein